LVFFSPPLSFQPQKGETKWLRRDIRTVSQFTLLASTKKGAKPDFHGAANPEEARRLYHYFVQKVKAGYMEERVKDGQFQAWMEVALVNDGPVTLELNNGAKTG
jgi:D-tyrosyl-tRNA(Tyr) deacylase